MFKIICAYPLNLDLVHDISAEEAATLVSITGAHPEQISRISRWPDLVSSLLFCMREGIGDEIQIENHDAAETIEQMFTWKKRLGGNAGIMADVLAQLGAEPILNAPGIGPTLALMLNENVRIPSAGMLLPPSDIPHGMEMKHFVIQFTAGMKLVSSSHEIDVLKDNRLIATFDPLNGRVSSTKDFDSYCKDHISQMNGALISGFHLLHDPDYRDIVDVRAQDIAGWKKDNPDLYVHCEMGSFHDRAIMRHVMKRLPFDSLGLNEDELGTLYDVEEGWSGTLNAAIDLFGAIKAQRVAVHTRDYIMSIMREDGLLPPEQEIEALTVGADAAAALASSGSVIARPPYEINPEGLRARDEILSVGGSSHGRGAWILHDDLVVCISPSRLSRRPSITVGLGDTATAATFLQEVKFISKRIAALKGEIK